MVNEGLEVTLILNEFEKEHFLRALMSEKIRRDRVSVRQALLLVRVQLELVKNEMS